MINIKHSCTVLLLRLVMRTKLISIASFIYHQPHVLQPLYWVGGIICKKVLRELGGSKFLVLPVSVKSSHPTTQVLSKSDFDVAILRFWIDPHSYQTC